MPRRNPVFELLGQRSRQFLALQVARSFVAVFERPTPRSRQAEPWNLLKTAIPGQGVSAAAAFRVVRLRLSSSVLFYGPNEPGSFRVVRLRLSSSVLFYGPNELDSEERLGADPQTPALLSSLLAAPVDVTLTVPIFEGDTIVLST